ncbi:hypothetical protein B0H11DRAFT_1952278, partial [Mycena galericulata]
MVSDCAHEIALLAASSLIAGGATASSPMAGMAEKERVDNISSVSYICGRGGDCSGIRTSWVHQRGPRVPSLEVQEIRCFLQQFHRDRRDSGLMRRCSRVKLDNHGLRMMRSVATVAIP